MRALIISTILLFNQFTFAACKEPVTYLLEGSKAPCVGYLFTPEKELQVRTTAEQFDKIQILVKQQDELIKVLSNRLDINLQQNANLRKQAEFNQSQTRLEQIIYFALGVAVGVGVTKVLVK